MLSEEFAIIVENRSSLKVFPLFKTKTVKIPINH